MGIRKPPGTTKRPPDGRKKLSTKRPRLVPPGHIAPLPPLERRLDSHPGPDEDFPEVPPGHDILQAPDDELLDRLLTLIGTIKPGQSLYEALDLDSLVHLGWLRRGQAEIDRVAAAPARRHIRASERPYVRWARLCGGLPTSAAPLVGENPSGADWPRHRLRPPPADGRCLLGGAGGGAQPWRRRRTSRGPPGHRDALAREGAGRDRARRGGRGPRCRQRALRGVRHTHVACLVGSRGRDGRVHPAGRSWMGGRERGVRH